MVCELDFVILIRKHEAGLRPLCVLESGHRIGEFENFVSEHNGKMRQANRIFQRQEKFYLSCRSTSVEPFHFHDTIPVP